MNTKMRFLIFAAFAIGVLNSPVRVTGQERDEPAKPYVSPTASQSQPNSLIILKLAGALGALVGTIGGLYFWFWSLIRVFTKAETKAETKTQQRDIVRRKGVVGDSPAPQQTGKRSLGVASLVLGILSILLPYLGLVCGIVAIVLAKKQRGFFREPLSMAGLITGIIGAVFWGLLIVALLFA